ncbi:MAG: hypothetical protein IJM34_06145 [Lachnospiraceae bacterium]|nr:hypothetical protein [Lachnospiraceae bacterium]
MKIHSIGNSLLRTSVAAFAIAALTCTGCGSSGSSSRSSYSGSREEADEEEKEQKPSKESEKDEEKVNDTTEESEVSTEPVKENDDTLWLCSKEESYNSDGTLDSTLRYAYDYKGNLIRRVSMVPGTPAVLWRYFYSYDGGMKPAQAYIESYNGEYLETDQMIYDPKGNLIKKSIMYDAMNVDTIEYTEYDEQNRITKTIVTDQDAGSLYDATETYTYDTDGNLKEVSIDKYDVSGTRTYRYDGGKLIETVETLYSKEDSDYKDEYRKVYVYDADGNVSRMDYYNNGDLAFYNLYEYIKLENVGTPSLEAGSADRLVEQYSDDMYRTALAVITMTWDVVDEGSLMIDDYMQISDDMSGVQLSASYTEYSDADYNLVYSRSDNHEEFMQGAESGMTETVEYYIYSYDHDFDLVIEPGPENKTEMQSVKVTIQKNDGTITNYTFEDIGRRGDTGIWYCNVCSCRGGQVL